MGRMRGDLDVKMISPRYYDTKILNTHISASDDNKSREPHSQKICQIPRGPSTHGHSTHMAPRIQLRTEPGTPGVFRFGNCNSSRQTWFQKNNTTSAHQPDTSHEYSLAQDVNGIEVKEHLKGHACQGVNRKHVEMKANFPTIFPMCDMSCK